MGDVKTIKKWDLDRGVFRDALTLEEKRKALSIVPFDTIKHNGSSELNYIIIADGLRIENYSHDAKRVEARRCGIENVIKYFERKNENYKIELLLVDNDCPLKVESNFLADYVSHIASYPDAKTVNVLGFSKCGVMVFDMIKYLTYEALMKTRAYSISSPYTGTIMASPLFLERKVAEIAQAKIPNRTLAERISKLVMAIYYRTMSNSHMDLDIAEVGGVPANLVNKYDPSFLGEIFKEENIQSVSRINHYENICTLIDDKVFKNALRTGNFVDIGLCILNEALFDRNADGMVPLSSQSEIESKVRYLGPSKVILSTHNILKTSRYANQLLDVVNNNMSDDGIRVLRHGRRN